MQTPWHWPLVSMQNGQCFHAQCSGIALFRSNVCPSLHWTTHSDLVVIGHLLSCSVHMGFLQWWHPACTEAVSQRGKWFTQEWRHAWMDKDLRAIQRMKLLPVLTFSCFHIDRHRSITQTGKVVHYSLLVFIISAVVIFTDFLSSIWTKEGCQKNSTHICGQK